MVLPIPPSSTNKSRQTFLQCPERRILRQFIQKALLLTVRNGPRGTSKDKRKNFTNMAEHQLPLLSLPSESRVEIGNFKHSYGTRKRAAGWVREGEKGKYPRLTRNLHLTNAGAYLVGRINQCVLKSFFGFGIGIIHFPAGDNPFVLRRATGWRGVFFSSSHHHTYHARIWSNLSSFIGLIHTSGIGFG